MAALLPVTRRERSRCRLRTRNHFDNSINNQQNVRRGELCFRQGSESNPGCWSSPEERWQGSQAGLDLDAAAGSHACCRWEPAEQEEVRTSRENRPHVSPWQKSCVNPRRDALNLRVRYANRHGVNFAAGLQEHRERASGSARGGGRRLEAAQQVSARPACAVRTSWHQSQPQSSASSRWLIRSAAPGGTRLQRGPFPSLRTDGSVSPCNSQAP